MAKRSKKAADAPPDPPPDPPTVNVDAAAETRVDVPDIDATPRKRKRAAYGSASKRREEEERLRLIAERRAAREAWRKQGEENAADAEMGLALLSEYLAARLGERWRFSEQERHKIAVVVMTLAAKHMPEWGDEYQEELALAYVALTIIAPRVVAELLEQAGLGQEPRDVAVEVADADAPPAAPAAE